MIIDLIGFNDHIDRMFRCFGPTRLLLNSPEAREFFENVAVLRQNRFGRRKPAAYLI